MAMFIYVYIRITVDGLEEFLIMPTAWYYIQELGQTHFFLGETLAAYSIGALVTSPFFGALDDRYRITKTILVFSAVFKFLGHLTYAIPINAYFALSGRLLSGFAGGSVGVLYGMVSRYTGKESRAKAFLFFGALYNVGTALAPSLGSILTFNFEIIGWKIGPGNSPGFLLAIIWFFMTIATVFYVPQNPGRENSSSLEEIEPHAKSDDELDDELELTSSRPTFDWKICCLYFLIFMVFFLYCVTGFYVPLLAVNIFHLQLIHVKLLFINATLIVFVGFFANYLASRYVLEKKLIVFWMSVQVIPILLLFYFDVTWNDPDHVVGPYLLLPLIMLGLPCFSYSMILALLSKVMQFQHAAFYLSLAPTVAHLSIIASRFIAGLTFSATSMVFTLIGISFLWTLQALWYYWQYKNFDCK